MKIKPEGKWYKEAGQGMEEVISMTDNDKAYTLSDRATYLAMKNKTNDLFFEKGPILFNPYGIIAINPEKIKTAKYKEAILLVNWIVSKKGQDLKSYFIVPYKSGT